MTLVTKSCKANFATDQDFRDFVTAVRTGFTDLGWVRTSDTGQIDPTTVVKPAAAAAVQGYDMFRMADTLQATAPFFAKVEYAAGGNSAAYAALWVQVGTSTSGAGAIAGQIGNRVRIETNGSDGLRTCTFAGGPNRIALMMFDTSTLAGVPFVFVCERSHADDGSDTAERADVLHWSSTTGLTFQQVPGSGQGPVSAITTNAPALVPPGSGSGTKGTDVGVYPLFPFFNGPLRNPPVGLLVYVTSDIGDLVDVPVSMYGTARTYRTHAVIAAAAWNIQGRSGIAPMILVS